jgi:hypothetical protein
MKYARSLAVGLGMSLACAFTQNANALEQGECKPYQEMVDTLKAEGQHSLIWAERWTEDEKSRPVRIITSNDNGKVGYQLGGDRAAGVTSSPENLCVVTVLTDVRLHDPYSLSVPDAFRSDRSVSDEEVQRISKEQGIGGSGDHNRVLDKGASNGMFPALQARVVLKLGVGPIFTLSVNTKPSEVGGDIRLTAENGYTSAITILQNVRLTERFDHEISTNGPRVASASLNLTNQ